MIIKDHVAELGIDTANIPITKAQELITLVSRSIPNQPEAEAFVQELTDWLEN